MRHITRFQRVAAVFGLLAILSPLSAFAEKRPLNETEFRRMVEELRRVLGEDAVEVGGAEGRAPERRTAPASPRIGAFETGGVVAAMNEYRRLQGLAPLRIDERLSAAARDRAEDMLEKRYFAHVSPDGKKPATFARGRGYRYAMIGENLAEGFRSADGVVNAWMNSPGHRANVLGNYRDVGIAVLPGSPTGQSRGATIVALYGSERG